MSEIREKFNSDYTLVHILVNLEILPKKTKEIKKWKDALRRHFVGQDCIGSLFYE
jgi:hypothetical protein